MYTTCVPLEQSVSKVNKSKTMKIVDVTIVISDAFSSSPSTIAPNSYFILSVDSESTLKTLRDNRD
jgi:hypothetical protein